MGSPLSPIVMNIYMERFEKITSQSARLGPKHWFRYVDDTFEVWPHGKATLNPFLDHLNSIYDYIQFTTEEENNNNQIAFLDISMTRENNRLSSTVFRKKTHTDRYLNYQSHHHPRVLNGVVTCLANRAHNICDMESKEKEVYHLRQAFQAKGYPLKVIEPPLKEKKKKRNKWTEDQQRTDVNMNSEREVIAPRRKEPCVFHT